MNRNIRKWIYGDRAILILCISIALIFWFLLRMGNTYTTTTALPIHYELPESWTFLNKAPEELIVQIEGSGWNLLSYNLSGAEKKLGFTLQKRKAQVIPYNLIRNKVQAILQSELQIVNISQDQLDIHLDPSSAKRVPVHLERSIGFQEGYHQLGPINFEPDSVEISGPKSLIDSIFNWPTDKLSLENIHSNQTVVVALVEPKSPFININQDKIQVEIYVEEQTTKTMYLPVEIRGIEDSIRIFPERVRADFIVGLSSFNQISVDDFTVVADFNEMETPDQSKGIQIQLIDKPESIRNLRINPKVVEFFYVEEEQ